jgi:hypothetical protein
LVLFGNNDGGGTAAVTVALAVAIFTFAGIALDTFTGRADADGARFLLCVAGADGDGTTIGEQGLGLLTTFRLFNEPDTILRDAMIGNWQGRYTLSLKKQRQIHWRYLCVLVQCLMIRNSR